MKTTTREKLGRVRSHYRMFGFWDTIRYGLVHLLLRTRDDEFDREYGTDTGTVQSMRYDEQPKPGQIVQSIPTHPRVLRYILRNLGIDYREFIFIDFGCGKGRAILCASDFPFARIIGVEWSNNLSAIAKRNLQIYNSSRQKCTKLEVHCMNVLDYEFPASNTVLYMYNPFGPKIIRQVFENVQRRVFASPHRFLVVYSGLWTGENTVVMECFDRFGIDVVRKCRTLNPRGSWVLGEARSPTGAPTKATAISQDRRGG